MPPRNQMQRDVERQALLLLVAALLMFAAMWCVAAHAAPPNCRIQGYDATMPDDEQALRVLLLDQLAKQQADPDAYRQDKAAQLHATKQQWADCIDRGQDKAPKGWAVLHGKGKRQGQGE